MRDLLASLGAERWLLPALLFWPLVASPVVALLGRDAARDEAGGEAPAGGPDARTLTLAALVVEALLGVALWLVVEPGTRAWQARVDLPWLPDLGARLSLGVDGLSTAMVVLTVLVMPLALLGAWENVRRRTPAFGALVLLLTAGLVGVFTALDLLLFYVAWELLLVPTFFLLGIWGGADGARANVKFVLFTMAGSLLMLVAIAALWTVGGTASFHLDDLLQARIGWRSQLALFGAFFLAFAIKSAMLPFHTWLPDAQRAAPTVAAIALGLKVGTYAIARFAIPLFPAAAADPGVRGTIMALAAAGIAYGALLAMAQADFKRMVSYTSISHLGFILLGLFAYTTPAVQGASMVMVNHGITSSALFLVAGMLEDRRGTVALAAYGGLARVVPTLAVALGVAMLATMGLPGTNGFIGEFLVLAGTFADKPVLATVATTGVVLAAMYGLRVLQRLLFEPLVPGPNARLRDLSARETLALAAFVVAIVWLGVAPRAVLERLEGTTVTLLEAVAEAARPVPAVATGAR